MQNNYHLIANLIDDRIEARLQEAEAYRQARAGLKDRGRGQAWARNGRDLLDAASRLIWRNLSRDVTRTEAKSATR